MECVSRIGTARDDVLFSLSEYTRRVCGGLWKDSNRCGNDLNGLEGVTNGVLLSFCLDLDMHLIYDVAHNICKFEEHVVNGKPLKLLVHRKGTAGTLERGFVWAVSLKRQKDLHGIVGTALGRGIRCCSKYQSTAFLYFCEGATRSFGPNCPEVPQIYR